MKHLDPGARWHFRFRVYLILVLLSIWFVPSLIGILFAVLSPQTAGLAIIIGLLIALIFLIIIGELYAHMAYNRWFYEFTADGLKLERGIIWKRYSNVPYERIQNVDVHRGIIARMFGFSSVLVQTAGYSGSSRGMHAEGFIPAVGIKEAEELREFVMKKIKQSHKTRQGL